MRRTANKMVIPLISGSDAHSKTQLNTVATKFKETFHSISDVVKAIKNENCKVI